MMEQLSYLPFGNPNSGAEDVLLHLNISDYQYRNVYRTDRNKVKAYVVNLMYKDDSLSCSYAAWLVYGCEKYIGIVNKYLQRRKKAIKKIKSIIKTLGILFRIYRNSIDNIYKPGGIFEKEASIRWKHYVG